MKESSDGESLMAEGMVPDLGSSKGENVTSEIDFCPGNVQERLARGTEQMTGLKVG